MILLCISFDIVDCVGVHLLFLVGVLMARAPALFETRCPLLLVISNASEIDEMSHRY